MQYFVLVLVRRRFCLLMGLLFVLEPGEEDADFIDIILEICRFVVFDKHDLPSAFTSSLFGSARPWRRTG